MANGENVPRKLEELDLMDDFLFQQMLQRGEDAEKFCRILLQTILGKEIRKVQVIPQRVVPGVDTDRHGIRMDAYIEEVEEYKQGNQALGVEVSDAKVVPEIYNLEPHKYKAPKECLPRQTRYYHALIDAKILESGVDYEQLGNVTTIMITPYDPFDRNRMLYTCRSGCVEEPDMPYEDGITTIYLYTKGTKEFEGEKTVDNRKLPSQKLRDMLHYIEKSRKENVTNQEIAELDELVWKVKQDRKVGVAYMQSWERERMIRREGREEESRDILLDFLEDIGPIPEDIRTRIEEQRDIGILRKWSKEAARAESMEEFRQCMEQDFVKAE